MTKLQNKKEINGAVWLFALTYMVSYLTRTNYNTIISEMESATEIARDLLSMGLTGSFITYGIGQIVSGFMGDKFAPKNLVTFGLFLTVGMNLLMPFCTDPYQMLVIWSINGFAQSFMWPPIVKLMVALFDSDQYKKATTKVIYGSSAGTILLYLISPLIITVSSWRAVFFFSAACGIVMILFWIKFCPKVDVKAEQLRCEKTDKTESIQNTSNIAAIFLTPMMLIIMFVIICQGTLRDGVATWTPSYIKDIYNLGSTVSILTGIVLPLFSMLCTTISAKLYAKFFRNPITCACIFFGIGGISSLMIILSSGNSIVVSLVFLALLTGSMHGVNMMLICMVPSFFEKTGKVSTVSGIVNSCTYVGSAVSTYGVAVISKNFGWSVTLWVWLGIAAIGTALLFVTSRIWQRKMK